MSVFNNLFYLMKKYLLSVLLIAFHIGINAQSPADRNSISKNNLYIYWGWNWSAYSESDINFKGALYDFTLANVVATDRPSPFSLRTYFHPLHLTSPQYNFRIGYFFKDRWDISFGIDHMKYVVNQNQSVLISGLIKGTDSKYDNFYEQIPIIIEPGFLELEHTDGLNYVNLEIRKHKQLFKVDYVELNTQIGAGFGGYIPRTDSSLLNFKRNDEWHWAGFGTHIVAGLNLTFFQHFFIQTEIKGGYINLPDIRTTISTKDVASQKFLFSQINILFGGTFQLNKKTIK